MYLALYKYIKKEFNFIFQLCYYSQFEKNDVNRFGFWALHIYVIRIFFVWYIYIYNSWPDKRCFVHQEFVCRSNEYENCPENWLLTTGNQEATWGVYKVDTDIPQIQTNIHVNFRVSWLNGYWENWLQIWRPLCLLHRYNKMK